MDFPFPAVHNRNQKVDFRNQKVHNRNEEMDFLIQGVRKGIQSVRTLNPAFLIQPAYSAKTFSGIESEGFKGL